MADVKKGESFGLRKSESTYWEDFSKKVVNSEEVNDAINLKSNEFIKDILDAYVEEKLIKFYSVTDKIMVTVCDGVEPSEVEEMLIGALYVAFDADSYYINIEVIK